MQLHNTVTKSRVRLQWGVQLLYNVHVHIVHIVQYACVYCNYDSASSNYESFCIKMLHVSMLLSH